MASLIVISWRDIPAQVIVKRGRDTAKVQLSARFQEASGFVSVRPFADLAGNSGLVRS